MKKLIPIITTLSLLITACTPAARAFSDVSENHPNAEAIAYVKSEGIVKGYDDGSYQPDKTINRAEFTKIIIEAKLGQEPLEHAGSCFTDVASGEGIWYYSYVCYAKRMNIIDGYDDGSFRPENKINFVEAAKIISNSMEYKITENKIWYKPFTEELAARKAIPLSITDFEHQLTRGEMAEIIFRLKTKNTSKSSQTYASLSGEAPSTENSQAYDPALLLSQSQLLALADNKYQDGEVSIGDGKYSLIKAQKGYIYYCRELPTGGGAQVEGPWISSDNWNFLEKISIDGAKEWADAFFSNEVQGDQRTITSNSLPTNHGTGTFPISRSEEGYQYDRNPNTISATSIKLQVPANPVYTDTPYCMPTGEVGVMINGVALFNGMDAEQRDAPAHEVQDECNGHPQEHGQYHYHNLSPCFQDTSVKTVIGYANDGFPITGPMVTEGKYLTTEDLDICHGITTEVTDENGKTYTTYHYVLTYDYPYSAGCYRSKPNTNRPTTDTNQPTSNQTQQNNQGPPAAAFTACKSKSTNASCSFTDNNHTVTGTCRNVPEGFVCAP